LILVDSSVWVDYLRGTPTPQADKLDALLGAVPLAVGDLILTEVLQGCGTDKEFNEVRRLLLSLTVIPIGGENVAIEAARNYRRLRALGLTVRKTIDTVIATRCIVDKLELLHSDRDFDPFEQHLGLRCVPCEG
jgi:predicted nucleic acid-binding protein